jgi:hypothetical protein
MSKSYGKRQWFNAAAALIFLVGYGIALHDFAHQVWELKGTPVSMEGGYIGFLMMAPVALAAMVMFLTSANAAVVQRDAVHHYQDEDWFYPSKENEGK